MREQESGRNYVILSACERFDLRHHLVCGSRSSHNITELLSFLCSAPFTVKRVEPQQQGITQYNVFRPIGLVEL